MLERERESKWEREWKSVSDSGIVCNVHCKQILSSKGNRIRIANDQKPKKKTRKQNLKKNIKKKPKKSYPTLQQP